MFTVFQLYCTISLQIALNNTSCKFSHISNSNLHAHNWFFTKTFHYYLPAHRNMDKCYQTFVKFPSDKEILMVEEMARCD